jgi:eukaryotic-like serine/threonine-protein kinase
VERTPLPLEDVTEAATLDGVPGPRADGAGRPEHGRYEVLELLGLGGMGAVYRARDPELRREVALKVLPSDSRTDSGAGGRLLREARAMAKLDHPNVVRVFDVGRSGHAVFIAMELIDGEDFRALLGRGPHPWRAIVELYTAAGRGLAAAHAVGLVHRDFKPGNVMRARDGSVRVLDFGLASGPRAPAPALVAAHDDATDTAQSLLKSSAGTPAYMAPEQIRGAGVDARADQFAFCVALWEALFGARPFRGNTFPELVASVLRDEPAIPTGARNVPPALVRVLRRGLRKEPRARYDDMPALLGAIGRATAPRLRRVATALLAASVLLAGVVAASSGGSACEETGDLDDVWNGSTRTEVGRRLAVHGDPASSPSVVASLDAWTDAWASARRAACTHLQVQPEAADLRLVCLRSRARELEITVDALLSDRDLTRASRAVSMLPTIDGCVDDETLALGFRGTSPADAAMIERLAPELDSARALERVGRPAESRERLLAMETRVAEISDPVFRARYQLARGRAEDGLGRIDAAEQAFTRGFDLAMEGGDDELALLFASVLVFVHAEYLRQPDTAEHWVHQAEALAPRVDDSGALADLFSNIGTLRSNQARFDEAIALHERALALREETFGPDDLRVAMSLNNLGVAKSRVGQLAEAEALHRRALALRESAESGPTTEVGTSLFNLGTVLQQAGRTQEGLKYMERAVGVLEALHGPEDRRLVAALGNWAAGLRAAGDSGRARELLRRAHGILARTLGDDHPDTAEALGRLGTLTAQDREWERAIPDLEEAVRVLELSYEAHPHLALLLNNLASCLCEVGRNDECIAQQRRALRMRAEMLPPDHPDLAVSRFNLGSALLQVGRLDEALAELDAALAIAEAAGSDVGSILTARAEVLVTMGRIAEAVGPAERAVELFAGRDETPRGRRDALAARFTLAKVRWASGRLRDAREGLDAVLASYREDPEANGRAIEEIERWRALVGA